LPKEQKLKEDTGQVCKIVLIGKPNVGKSSLMNLITRQERSIVAQEPGTTREAISEKITFYKGDIQITDTAGVRRKKAVKEKLENLMVKSTFRALEDANLVLLLVDASEGKLSDQELKLAFYAFENYKALIIIFNKQDLVTDYDKEQIKVNLDLYKHLIKKVEVMNISCKTEKNVGKVLAKVKKVWERHSQTFPNEDLAFLFKENLARKPLFHKTMSLVIRHVRQVSTAPITLLLIVNVPKWFGKSQLGFFENLLRRNFDLRGVPGS